MEHFAQVNVFFVFVVNGLGDDGFVNVYNDSYFFGFNSERIVALCVVFGPCGKGVPRYFVCFGGRDRGIFWSP